MYLCKTAKCEVSHLTTNIGSNIEEHRFKISTNNGSKYRRTTSFNEQSTFKNEENEL